MLVRYSFTDKNVIAFLGVTLNKEHTQLICSDNELEISLLNFDSPRP